MPHQSVCYSCTLQHDQVTHLARLPKVSTEGMGLEPQSVARMGSVTLVSCIWMGLQWIGETWPHLHIVRCRAVHVVGQVQLEHSDLDGAGLTCWKVNERKCPVGPVILHSQSTLLLGEFVPPRSTCSWPGSPGSSPPPSPAC